MDQQQNIINNQDNKNSPRIEEIVNEKKENDNCEPNSSNHMEGHSNHITVENNHIGVIESNSANRNEKEAEKLQEIKFINEEEPINSHEKNYFLRKRIRNQMNEEVKEECKELNESDDSSFNGDEVSSEHVEQEGNADAVSENNEKEEESEDSQDLEVDKNELEKEIAELNEEGNETQAENGKYEENIEK
jgi:hypothetical protein